MAITISLKAAAEQTAASLGRLVGGEDSPAKVTVKVDNKTFTIPRILDLVPDEETLRDWFLYITDRAGPKAAEWRRVDTVSTSNVVCVQDFTNPPLADEYVQLYSILTPDQWRLAVKTALANLYFEDRVEITLASEQNLYTPAAGAEWLQSKGQILRYLFRDTSSGATNITEESVGFIRPIEEDNALKFYLPNLSSSVTNIKLIVVARHPYEAPANDAATTTCPAPLLKAQAKWEALMLIREYLGAAKAKQLFGMAMVVAEQEMSKQRARWLPMGTFQDLREEEPWLGVDTAGIPTEWSW